MILTPTPTWGTGKRGIFSFTKENIPLLNPQEKGFRLAVSGANDLYASGMQYLRAAKPRWQEKAGLIKFKVDGDCVRVTNRRQSDSEDRSKPSRVEPSHGRHPIPQAVQLFKPKAGNVNLSLGGSKGGHSLL